MEKIKFRKTPLAEDDVIELVDYNIIDRYRDEHDNFVFECFSRFGFTRDWLLDPIHRPHVKIIRYEVPARPDYRDVFTVYDRDIFFVDVKISADGILCSMAPCESPTEIKKLFGFPVEEAANDAN